MIHTPLDNWRLIDTGPLSGALNMAVDEALLRCFDPGSSSPVLRLYGWEPSALSLGRFQKAGAVLDIERCRAEGIPVVRRVTGGGVIYHSEELTYSIICSPAQIPPASSVKDSFRVLTGFLLAFYHRLGLQAEYAADAMPDLSILGEKTDFCFAGRETFDILASGRKIGGNAQKRMKNLIFQHGSIPIVNRAATGLTYMRDNSPLHALGATSLVESGIHKDRTSLCHEIKAAFSGNFSVRLQEEGLSFREHQAVDDLLAMKYSMDKWNLEGVER